MADWLEILNSTITDTYVHRVFTGINAPTTDIVIFFLISLLVGFIVLTLRYTINPRDEKEYSRWKDENIIAKIFLSLITGFFGYVTVLIIEEFLRAIKFSVGGKLESILFSDYFSIFAIVFSVIYTFTFFIFFRINQKEPYKDIEKFALWHVFIPFILALTGTAIAVFRFSIPLSIIILLLDGVVLAWFIMTCISKKKHENKR